MLKAKARDDLVTKIDGFINHYDKKLMEYHNRPAADSERKALTDACVAAIKRKRNTIYLFGNGGSHAIARHFEISLNAALEGTEQTIRLNHGVDFHTAQGTTTSQNYNRIFVSILENEEANKEDLVICISGSGNSDNLLLVAAHCKKKGIQCISFAGFNGGKLSRPKVTDFPLIAPIHDQQICEDAIQQQLHMLAWAIHDELTGSEKDVREDFLSDLACGLSHICGDVIEEVADAVSDAYLDKRQVFLLAPEGGGFSISGEHVAHNLNWDAVFEVKNPPPRRIRSTPTPCDFSGIGNDRLMPGIVSCQQLNMAHEGDVLILYCHDADSPAVRNTMALARETGMTIYVVTGKGELSVDGLMCFQTCFPEVTADLHQVVGHIIGRTVRLNLKIKLNQTKSIGSDVLKYLVEGDLAQRRLLNVVSGV